MKKTLITIAAVAAVALPGAAIAGDSGAAPRTVDLNVACTFPNQLNCTWYGEKIWPGASDNPPVYTATFWFNYADPDGQFCRYRLVPIRQLTCTDHWPLTKADEFGNN